MKRIPLTQGKVALVSDEDYEYLMQWKWYARRAGKTFYAGRHVRLKLKQKVFHMHRVIAERLGILEAPDHKDRNGLNNQRSNLRAATISQNKANRGRNKNNTSGYKGVYWDKERKKMVRSNNG